jgi:methyl-accepting chemotaxis protein
MRGHLAMKKLFAKSNISFMAALIMLVTPAIVCLIISIILMGMSTNSTYDQGEKLYYDTLYKANSSLVNADRDLYQAFVAGIQYYDMKQVPDYADMLPGKLADYEENMQQALDRVRESFEIAKGNELLYTGTTLDDSSKTIKDLEAEFETAYASWSKTYDLKADSGDWAAFNSEFNPVRGALSDMTDIIEKWAEQEAVYSEQAIASQVIRVSIIFGVIIVIILLLIIFTALSLSGGVKRVVNAIDNMADGDFITHLETDSPIKEFKGIALSAENMRHNLHEALKRIIENAQGVDNGATDAKDKIAASQQATADINQAVSDLAEGATAMANDVQFTSNMTINIGNAVEDVLTAANSNMENGRNVIDESTRVQNQLGDLMESGLNTREKAGRVSESVNETATVVAQISQSAELIISIANQTNLLALNASIEAARAGEAGKGFAVVADNIKDLAEKSNDAANEITDMLKQITDLSEQNKSLTEDIRIATEKEADALNDMSASFEEMLATLSETETGNKQIVSLVQQLDDNKNSIIDSVESLSSVSEENAASTQETSASLTMLDSNMVNVVEHAENLKQIAEELRDNVAMFKI